LAALTLNAANEIAVAAFLAGRIKLPDIYAVVEKMVAESGAMPKPSLADLLEADLRVRKRTEELIASETFVP
jgi:1-deoxy-D-xylulose-5-phosphate reductoisomerase